ncbi:TPM domain-containing protein [Corynebacterium felinum]
MLAAPLFVAHAQQVSYLAEAPEAYSDIVTDLRGQLSPEEIDKITDAAAAYSMETGGQFRLVLVNDFDGLTPERWTEEVLNRIGAGPNDVVMAVSTNQFGFTGGSGFSDADLDRMWNASSQPLAQRDFAGSAIGLLDAASNAGGGAVSDSQPGSATSGSAASSGQSTGSALWTVAGLGALGATGGGLYVASRRRRKQDSLAVLEQARSLDPADSSSLARLPLDTLESLAQEELVSTDESIKNARAELDIAIAEFGAERTRSFTRAMNHSTQTLQKAFGLKQRLDTQQFAGEIERRALLVEIISSCGQADDALDAEAVNFAQLRDLLVNAPAALDKVTQASVDITARMPAASVLLEQLKSDYSAPMIAPIADNVQLAQAALDEANRQLDLSRTLLARPAGEQGGLVDAVRLAEQAAAKADQMLAAIENAQADITRAQVGIPELVKEVQSEIDEAVAIRAKGQSLGTAMNWDLVDGTIARARTAVEQINPDDPLSTWATLTDIDAQLDELLDQLRQGTASHERMLQVYTQQSGVATAQIRAAQDFISARGRVVKAGARTKLAEAERAFAQAEVNRNKNTREAINFAREAASLAQQAMRLAQRDDDDYRRRHSSSNNTTGAMIAGMVINELLNSGHRHGGGFSGGFGGGGSRGGSFGGGGSRGGSF